MNHPSFEKASQAFSKILENIPQDNFPRDLLNEAIQELESMRNDSGRFAFGMKQGEQLLPNQSNLAFGISLVFQNRWNKENAIKALLIDTYLTETEESPNLLKAFDYEDERDQFVALQMVKLLDDQKQNIPNELSDFMNIRRGGSKEGE